MKAQQRLNHAILAVVENQLTANDPPEIRTTLERLMAAGFTAAQGKELIGNVVVVEIFAVLKEGSPFDRQRYVAALDHLPELPALPLPE